MYHHLQNYYYKNNESIEDEDIDIIEVESNDFNEQEELADDDDDLEAAQEQEEADLKYLEDLLDDSDEKYFYATKVTMKIENALSYNLIEL